MPSSVSFDRRGEPPLVSEEFVSTDDPGVIKILLKITDKGDYDWVECGACGAGWQVPHFESVG